MNTPHIKTLAVFCGAQPHVENVFLTHAASVGAACAAKGIHLIYGGGDCGMMGALADAALHAGAQVTGVFPRNLHALATCHARLTSVHEVDDMHTRKHTMYRLADAFLILPGGFGTLDEFFEVLTWRQIGLHTKPIVIHNINDYWNPLLHMLEHMVQHGFALPSHASYCVSNTTQELWQHLGITS